MVTVFTKQKEPIMKSEIVTYSLRFNRTAKKLKPGEKARVSLQFYFDRDNRRYFPTKVKITKEQWDQKNKRINSKHPNHLYLNNYLTGLVKEFQDYEAKLKVEGEAFAPVHLEKYLNNHESQKGSFNNFFKTEMEDVQSKKFPSMKKEYEWVLQVINRYNENLGFKDMNYATIERLEIFLIEKYGYSLNSRALFHDILKKFITIAISKGLMRLDAMPYKMQFTPAAGKFVIKRTEGAKTPLNFSELGALEKYSYPKPNKLETQRKIFLFMCYTGLRVSDSKAFNVTHLVYTEKGYSIDLKRMEKTEKPVYLELFTLFEGKPERILREFLKDKYGTDDYKKIVKSGDTSPIFEGLDTTIFNRKIKDVARDAGIIKNLSSHCGRHTFGTLMCILTGDLYLVMNLMGHTKPETTMVYIKLGEKMMNAKLRSIDWKAYQGDNKEGQQDMESGKPPKEKNKKVVHIEEKGSPGQEVNTRKILSYIHSAVLPSIDLGIEGQVPFAIDTSSLKRYVGLLPFSPDDIKRLKEKPAEVTAFIIGMKHAQSVERIEKALNNAPWFKDSYIKLRVGVVPVPLNNLEIVQLNAPTSKKQLKIA